MFYVFEQDMQVSFNKISNFPDSSIFLNEWCHFYTDIGKFPDNFMSWTSYAIFNGVDILHFPHTL